jgi:hypothetical protein
MWEPTNPIKIQAEITYDLVKIDVNTYEIRVSSDNLAHIVADVVLQYKTDYVTNACRLQTLRRLVAITDESMAEENSEGWNVYFIPPESEGYNIPICISKGAGKITVKSLPAECAKLEIIDLQIVDLLPNYHYSITN